MKKAAVIKILEKYDIDEYHYKLEIADEIAALEQESKEPIEDYPVYDKEYLDECIEKATLNLSKIKDVDKALDEIRGVEQEGKEQTTDRCHKIYEKVKEAWSVDKRTFEQAESKGTELHPVDLKQVMDSKQESAEEILHPKKLLKEYLGVTKMPKTRIMLYDNDIAYLMQEYHNSRRREVIKDWCKFLYKNEDFEVDDKIINRYLNQ